MHDQLFPFFPIFFPSCSLLNPKPIDIQGSKSIQTMNKKSQHNLHETRLLSNIFVIFETKPNWSAYHSFKTFLECKLFIHEFLSVLISLLDTEEPERSEGNDVDCEQTKIGVHVFMVVLVVVCKIIAWVSGPIYESKEQPKDSCIGCEHQADNQGIIDGSCRLFFVVKTLDLTLGSILSLDEGIFQGHLYLIFCFLWITLLFLSFPKDF